MDRTPSKSLAALWMAGWLALMLVVAVAGREAMREMNVFQLMEARSILGFLMLYPLQILVGFLIQQFFIGDVNNVGHSISLVLAA